MSMCKKCNGRGGIWWNDDPYNGHWEFCDECGGTGETVQTVDCFNTLQNATDTAPPKPTIYQRALNLWGEQAQLNMAIQECAELIVALTNINRNRGLDKIHNVVDEIADVIIMMEQMRLVYGDELVDAAIRKKLARLKERIEYGEGHN